MILIKSIMEKQLDMWEDYKRNRYYLRAISVYGSLLNMALAVLDRRLNTDKSREVNRLWINSDSKKRATLKYRLRMEKYFKENFGIIIEAFEKIQNIIASSSEYSSKLYKSGGFMIQDYEYPETETA